MKLLPEKDEVLDSTIMCKSMKMESNFHLFFYNLPMLNYERLMVAGRSADLPHETAGYQNVVRIREIIVCLKIKLVSMYTMNQLCQS